MALASNGVLSFRGASCSLAGTAPRARPAAFGLRAASRAHKLAARSKGGADDGWESWGDAPDTPAVNGGAQDSAEAGGLPETDWRTEVQGLARSLRSTEQGAAPGQHAL